MKKICLLFGILFLLCGIVYAEVVSDNEKLFFPSSAFNNVEEAYLVELGKFITAKKKEAKNIPDGGVSIMRIKIMSDGTIADAQVYYNSGNAELDNYLINFLKNLGKFKPLPNNKIYMECYIPFAPQGKSTDIKNVDFKPYMKDMQRIIKFNWNRTQTVHDKDYRTVVLFHINNDGQIERSVIFKSSGNKYYDDEALNALRTVKLKPLPKEYNGKGLDIQFTFDCRVHNKYSMGPVIPAEPKPIEEVYYENLDKNLLIVKKNLIRERDEYKYIHALKLNDFSYTAYLLQSKVDCKNHQIGVKRIYAGASNMSYNVLGFTRLVNIFPDDVKMQAPDKNDDYLKIYNYVCEP